MTISIQVSLPKINVQVVKLWVEYPLGRCFHLYGGKGVSICNIDNHLTDQRYEANLQFVIEVIGPILDEGELNKDNWGGVGHHRGVVE